MTPRFANPFLPSYEYIPDGEPKIFGSRVYLYGSHDRFNGSTFCMNDYVCWSAPVTDLSDWKFEGTIYRQSQHPHRGLLPIDRCFAPDVAQGPDGRYYLYYGYSFTGRLYVAVSHRPTGPFEYLDEIHYANGTPLGHGTDPMGFDPGIFIDTDGTIYLYYGFGAERFPLLRLYGQHTQAKGAYVVVLSSDMVTIQQGPLSLGIPLASQSLGTSFEQHAFFEASSIRRYGDTYYFIYSSTQGHELCYATSSSPLGPFTYGGVLISNGDIGFECWTSTTHAGYYTGNNHGSLLHCEGQDYIFYHRHTNRHAFSRQACVERVMRTADGHFIQAERTSSGASPFPLPGYGIYDAHIACHLISPTGTRFYGNLITTKLNTRFHGYGLKSIRSAVDKYHGSVSINTDSHWFKLTILLPKPN